MAHGVAVTGLTLRAARRALVLAITHEIAAAISWEDTAEIVTLAARGAAAVPPWVGKAVQGTGYAEVVSPAARERVPGRSAQRAMLERLGACRVSADTVVPIDLREGLVSAFESIAALPLKIAPCLLRIAHLTLSRRASKGVWRAAEFAEEAREGVAAADASALPLRASERGCILCGAAELTDEAVEGIDEH